MTSQDIMAIVAELKTYNNLRISNVYDNSEISSQSIILKTRSFDKEIQFLIIDAGKKIYLSEYKIENERSMPTGFVMKLRKHLVNKIMLGINQFNNENILDMSFGFTDVQYRLIVELNGAGNIILTDNNYCILAQLRTNFIVNDKKDNDKKDNDEKDKDNEKTAKKAGDTYVLTAKNSYDITKDVIIDWYKNLQDDQKDKIPFKKLMIMSPLYVFGKECIEHSLCLMNIDNNSNINDVNLDDIIEKIKGNFVIGLSKGYLMYEKDNDNYEAYYPMIYEQFKNRKFKTFNTMSFCMEEYYRITLKQTAKKASTEKKKPGIDKEKQKLMNIARQVKKMEGKWKENEKMIEVFETHSKHIDLILKCANSYGNTKESLNDYMARLNEHIEADDIDFKVSIIFEKTNKVNVQNKKIRIVYIPNGFVYICSPNTSAYENIGILYAENKKLLEKVESTKRLVDREMEKYRPQKKVIKPTETTETNQTITNESETTEKQKIIIKKRELWYQQFFWFVSTEGILVLLGKNADQNETLVKKFMEKDDLYMHSEMAGSGSCIIKRINKNEIPIGTLEEANIFLMSHTKAWIQNSPDRTYWVLSDQVSKTPESGEYVTKGSFIIRGTKNYLSIPKMELGMTIMFKNKGSEILTTMLTETTEFAVPMCAPYKVINKNKYKIKIVSGTGKIDKTIKKTIIGTFIKQSNPKESIYIKEISIEDYQKVLIAGIKIL
jgi:predicted ribosome quality control (RQC) complex YloA/Tae2 family protein